MCAWRDRNRAPGASLTFPNEGHNPRRAFRPVCFSPLHLIPSSASLRLPLFFFLFLPPFLFFSSPLLSLALSLSLPSPLLLLPRQQERQDTRDRRAWLLLTSIEQLSLGTRDVKGTFCLLDCLLSSNERGRRNSVFAAENNAAFVFFSFEQPSRDRRSLFFSFLFFFFSFLSSERERERERERDREIVRCYRVVRYR